MRIKNTAISIEIVNPMKSCFIMVLAENVLSTS